MLSSNDEAKSFFTPWKLESIKKYKFLFSVCCITLNWYLFLLIVLIKLDSDSFNSFTLSWDDKVRTGTLSFASAIVNFEFWFSNSFLTKWT